MFIRLNQIKIFAHHGVYEEEIKNGNHFEIDLEVETIDSDGTKSDTLIDTLDYSELYRTVIDVSESLRYNLIEAFASAICIKILGSFPTIEFIKIRVRKLNPPLGGEVKNVEVEIHKRRTNA